MTFPSRQAQPTLRRSVELTQPWAMAMSPTDALAALRYRFRSIDPVGDNIAEPLRTLARDALTALAQCVEEHRCYDPNCGRICPKCRVVHHPSTPLPEIAPGSRFSLPKCPECGELVYWLCALREKDDRERIADLEAKLAQCVEERSQLVAIVWHEREKRRELEQENARLVEERDANGELAARLGAERDHYRSEKFRLEAENARLAAENRRLTDDLAFYALPAATLGAGCETQDDHELVRDVTRVVREADQTFERVGGSSRHWVRDCFLPVLHEAGFVVVKAEENEKLRADRLEKLRAETAENPLPPPKEDRR